MKVPDISATIRPDYDNPAVLLQLASLTNIIRVPFWPESVKQMSRNISLIKTIEPATKVLIDIPGKKYRLGRFEGEYAFLHAGHEYFLRQGIEPTHENELCVSDSAFFRTCEEGDEIVCGDGEALLTVKAAGEAELLVICNSDAKIRQYKGVAVRGYNGTESTPDKQLLIRATEFAARNDIDWVALSFTSSPNAIEELRSLLQGRKSAARVMGKIENVVALRNLDAIVRASDGLMVGRGDLLVYTPFEQLYLTQTRILNAAHAQAKYCMLSTGMMTSLLQQGLPRPAEIADLSMAVLAGYDAVQLCEETAVAANPLHAVQIVKRIINTVAKETIP